jgi:ferritin-like metal-binding protein YciE
MAMDLREYARMRCANMLQTERELGMLNGAMLAKVNNAQLHEIIGWHTQHLREQVSLLQQVVDHLGGFVGSQESTVAKGIADSFFNFTEMGPPSELIDLHTLQITGMIAVAKIALYRGLIDIGHLLGDREMIEPLERCQADEERMRQRVEEHLRPLETELSGKLRRAA